MEFVADFYAAYSEPAPPREELRARLREAIEQASLPARVERVLFAVAEPARGRGMSAVDFASFRRAPDGGFREDDSLPGLHPMMAERLRLWRLAEFELARLPSAEDVYLYRGVARANPKDERLFALAEVRDLTPVRDDSGRLRGAARAGAGAGRDARGDARLPGPARAAQAVALEPSAPLRVAHDRVRRRRRARA